MVYKLKNKILFFMLGILLILSVVSSASAAAFVIGNKVEVYNTGSSGLLVRSPYSPCGTSIGIKYDGSVGTVIARPYYCSGYNRWKIKWDNGLVGWSAENYLRKKAVCSNECSSGQVKCNGNYKQSCGNYDADSCLEWGGNSYCTNGCAYGQCVNSCVPKTCSQLGKKCGAWNNGCSQTINCGTCSSGQTCSNGQCVNSCVPNCNGKQCGDNGCGGSCGTCSSGQTCSNGACVSQGSNKCWSSSSLSNQALADLVIKYFPDGIVSQTGENIRVTAYAIARAESNGNPSACGDGDQSIGLWQIYLPAHPEFNRDSLFDKDYNANAALQVSNNGKNWNPWCTWEPSACKGKGDRRYLNYTSEAKQYFNSVSCTNECSSGQVKCNGNYKQSCGNYDADSCLEWGGNSYCTNGCAYGQCVNSCVPKTCSQLGKKCGAWNNGCSQTINCGSCVSGQTCSNGVCVSQGPQTTGWKSPSKTGSFYNQWTNPTNAFVSDNIYATSFAGGRWQDYGGFNFNIPTNAKINGIEVKIEGYGLSSQSSKIFVNLGNPMVLAESRNNYFLPKDSDGFLTLGNSTDTWKRNWTASEINNLGVWVYNTGYNIWLDNIQVKVYYS